MKRVLELREEGRNLNEMAVLYRTNAQSRSVEEIFIRILNRKPTGQEINAALASMAGLEAEHKMLAAEWQAKEAEQKPIIAKAGQFAD